MTGPNGEEHWSTVNYTAIESQKHFSGKDAFTDSDGELNKAMPQSIWDVTFADNGQDTLVEFHISYKDLAQLEATIQMGFKEGITMTLDYLSELLPSLKK